MTRRLGEVLEATMAPQSKSEIALAELDRPAAAGVRFSTMLGDAGCGMSTRFRHRLDV